MNNIEAIFSSDLERARDTATIINNNLNLQLYYTKDFR
ncbi:histidine phosphatase family protein [bacterium]|nr:histidine phosphatase family protein [bacterium]